MQPPYIQIIPSSPFIIENFINEIFNALSSQNSSANIWKIINFKDPRPGYHEIKTFIKFNSKIYKNLGYLEITNHEDHIRVTFLQPKYGNRSSDKCISFLFSEFIAFLKSDFSQYINSISILDFDSPFLNNPHSTTPYINIFVNRYMESRNFASALLDNLHSQNSPFISGGFQRHLTLRLQTTPDRIQIRFIPIQSPTPQTSQSMSQSSRCPSTTIPRLSISHLYFLTSFHIHKHFPSFSEGLQLFNP